MILNANSRLNLLTGAISSGKTHVGIDLLIRRMASQPPGNCLLTGKTIDTFQRNVLDPMRERFGPAYIGNVTGKPLHVNIFGRKCYVVGANDERAYRKVQGISLVYAHSDELTGYPDSFIKWLLGRLRIPGAIWDSTMNPENPNHPIKKDIIDREDLDRKVWHFTIDDNPFLDPIYVAQMKLAYTGVWHDRLIKGLWVAAEGAIYGLIDERVHVVKELPTILKYWVGCDYGTGSVTTFWLLGQGIDNCMYFVDFIEWDVAVKQSQLSDPEVTKWLDDWLESLNVTPLAIVIPADALSFAVYLQKHKAETKRIAHLRWADRSPGSVVLGIRDVHSLFSVNRLKFGPKIKAKKGLDSWQGYVWDPKAILVGEDAPLKINDHHADAGRYVISYVKSIWSKWLQNASA